MRQKKLVVMGLAAVSCMGMCLAGCSSGSSSSAQESSAEAAASDSSVQEASKPESSGFFLGEARLTDETIISEELDGDDHTYAVYSDGEYTYYMNEDGFMAMMISEDEDLYEEIGEADESVILSFAKDYISENTSLGDTADEDWTVKKSGSGVYTVDLYQEVYGEDLIVASFMFAGEKVSSINLWADVLDDIDEDVSPISSDEAADLAAEAIESEYETYQTYAGGKNIETEAVLNARDGKLYWNVTISNGEYGGYIAELDAFTGKCVSTDQLK